MKDLVLIIAFGVKIHTPMCSTVPRVLDLDQISEIIGEHVYVH